LQRLHFWLTAVFGVLLLVTVVWGLVQLYGMR
jgi:hypothetical protein